jgi:hypothetical protein
MESLQLYESCVEADPESKLREEPEDRKDDPLMQRKMDYQQVNFCAFEDIRSHNTKDSHFFLRFDPEKSAVRFSNVQEILEARNRTDMMRTQRRRHQMALAQPTDDAQYIDKKCIRLFPRNPTLQELEKKQEFLSQNIDKKLFHKVQFEIEDFMADPEFESEILYEKYLPQGQNVKIELSEHNAKRKKHPKKPFPGYSTQKPSKLKMSLRSKTKKKPRKKAEAPKNSAKWEKAVEKRGGLKTFDKSDEKDENVLQFDD